MRTGTDPAAQARARTGEKIGRGAYTPAKQRTNACLNLQVEARLQPGSGAEGTRLVVCAHLAGRFATHPGKVGSRFAGLSTPGGVRAAFDGRMSGLEAEFLRLRTRTDESCKHVFGASRLGRYLASLASNLPASARNAPSRVDCLLLTATHAMALLLQRKSDEGGGEYYTAALYDPNVTDNAKRIVVGTPGEFEPLDLKAMLISPENVPWYGRLPDDGAEPALAAICLDPGVARGTARVETAASIEKMYVALANGSSLDVRTMLDSLPDQSGHGATEFLRLTGGVLGPERVPTLHRAMISDSPRTVGMFTDAVLRSGMDPAEKADLLSIEDPAGLTPLHTAMGRTCAGTVEAFVGGVLDSGFGESAQFRLLTVESRVGFPALHTGMAIGNATTTGAFVKAVLGAGSSSAQKFDLLGGRDREGFPALHRGLLRGDAETVQAFVEPVLASSDLGRHGRIDLLMARDPLGRTALFRGVVQGGAAGVGALVKSVLASSLNTGEKRGVLNFQDGLSLPALHAGMSRGNAATVAAFVAEVLASGLDFEDKKALLEVGDAHGVSALHKAVAMERTDAAVAFVQAVKASGLSPEQKHELLGLPEGGAGRQLPTGVGKAG